MNNYIAHLPIRVGFLVQKNRQVSWLMFITLLCRLPIPMTVACI